MTRVFTHALTVLALSTVSLVWLTPFVERVLAVLWPITALALAVIVACAALALSLYLMGLGVRSLRTPADPIEIIQPTPMTFARDVINSLNRDDEFVHRERWDVATVQFCTTGEAKGFSVRKLLPYITRDKRKIYVDLLTANPPERPVLNDYGEGTQWSHDWSLWRLRLALKHRMLTLPYPKDDPPAVLWVKPGQTHTAHTARTPNTASTPHGVTYLSPMSGD